MTVRAALFVSPKLTLRPSVPSRPLKPLSPWEKQIKMNSECMVDKGRC